MSALLYHKLNSTIKLNIVESGVKHHQTNKHKLNVWIVHQYLAVLGLLPRNVMLQPFYALYTWWEPCDSSFLTCIGVNDWMIVDQRQLNFCSATSWREQIPFY